MATADAGTLPAAPGTAPTSDVALRKYLARIEAARHGQRAVQFHLSRLQLANRQDNHIQIAANMLENTVTRFGGRLFPLRTGDIVVIGKGMTVKALADLTDTLRHLFRDDPLVQSSAAPGHFSTVYDLQLAYPAFLAALTPALPAAAAAVGDPGTAPPAAAPRARAVPERASVDPFRASDLLDAVSRADFASMIRWQTIWSAAPGKTPEPVFDEFFISMRKLREEVGVNFGLADDPHFFQYLTRYLDKYILANLRDHSSLSRPISININLATLLSPDFLKFDDRRPMAWRDRILIELPVSDLLSDLKAFLYATDLLKQRGYSRCLDGITPDVLPYINLERLDVEYVKLIWDDSLLLLDDTALREVWQTIKSVGTHRVILARCGREEAMIWGHAAQLSLFQGHEIDRLCKAKSGILR